MENFKSGFVAVIGRPNTGKSTFLNAVIGEKVAIVSDKPQTTRNLLRGFYTTENYQIVFTDTPGMHKPRTALGDYMVSSVKSALDGIDAVIYMIDAAAGLYTRDKEWLSALAGVKAPVIVGVNKIDAAESVAVTLIEEEIRREYPFVHALVRLSAATGEGVNELVEQAAACLPYGPPYYDPEYYTDQTEAFMVAEIIREKALLLLRDEVPHGIGVDVERLKNKKNCVSINASIICEKKSHKGMVIGKGGAMLKEIGSLARADIERLMGKKVYLELWVKVRDDWRNDPTFLRQLGYVKRD